MYGPQLGEIVFRSWENYKGKVKVIITWIVYAMDDFSGVN